jgi:hypothetical protein
VLYRGELPRADAAGAGERHTRRIVSALLERGVLTADSAPLGPSGNISRGLAVENVGNRGSLME